MNQIKKYLGLVWLIIGPLALCYLIKIAFNEIALKPGVDTKIQWGVFLFVAIPIVIGFTLFGWYAIKGEYESD